MLSDVRTGREGRGLSVSTGIWRWAWAGFTKRGHRPWKEEDGGQGGLRATGFLLQLRGRGQLSLLPGLGLPHLRSGSGNTAGVFTDHSILLFEAPERSGREFQVGKSSGALLIGSRQLSVSGETVARGAGNSSPTLGEAAQIFCSFRSI